MHLKLFNSFLFISLFASSLLANTNILSNTQNNILDLTTKKSNEDVSKLKKDWIDKNAITYTYSYSKSDDERLPELTKQSKLSINQSIFRSGGIYYAIKYASNIKEDSQLSIKMQKQNLIVQTLNTVYSIKKLDLLIQQKNLALKNAIIDYDKKKESVFNGLLDISFLNNAILLKNKTKISLLDLELTKQNLINTLTTLSDLSYNDISLPSLNIIKKNKFTNSNLNIKKSQLNIKKQTSLSGVSNAQYLPKVVLNYSKTLNHVKDTNSHAYGFSVVVPLDFKTLNAIQSNKLALLKEKANQTLIKEEEEIFFKSNELEINNLDKKILITNQNIRAYKELLSQTKEQYDAGLKTSNDVEVLSNSKQSEILSVKIYEIDKQMKLLELYKRLANDKI